MSLVGGLTPPRDEPLVVNVGQLSRFPRLVILERDDASPTGFQILELPELSIAQLEELAIAIADHATARRRDPHAGDVLRMDLGRIASRETLEVHPHLDAL